MAVVSIDNYPVTSTIDGDIGRKFSVTDPPHVVVTFNKSPVQSLLLDKPGGRAPEMNVQPCIVIITLFNY